MIKAIIFDCFGVIITDALELLVKRAEATDPKLRNYVLELVHASNRGYIGPEESNEQISKLLGMKYEEYREAIRDGEVKDQQVVEWIKNLRTQYKTAMLSNISRGGMDKRFTKEELSKLFDVVATSGDLGMAKPDREIYEHTARELDVLPEECVFIDDREGHLEGAKVAGMQTVLFQSSKQAMVDLEKLLAKYR